MPKRHKASKRPTRRMRGAIKWFGGKGNMTAKLLPLIPRHRTYVEAFGGGAALMFAKAPSQVEVYNDLNEALVNLFRVMRDPEQFDRFRELCLFTLYSRAEWLSAREHYRRDDGDEVARAHAFYVLAGQSFGGTLDRAWGSSVTHSRRGRAGTTSRWLSAIDRLPAIHQRMLPVQIECQDFRKLLLHYDRPETFWYLDPPYPHSTREQTGRYAYEMTDADHADLVELLLRLEGMAVLSCYDHPIYRPLRDAGWTRKQWTTACYATGRTRAIGIRGKGAAMKRQKRIETVYISPKCQARLKANDTHHASVTSLEQEIGKLDKGV